MLACPRSGVRPRLGALDIFFALGPSRPYVLRHHGQVEVVSRPGTPVGVLEDPEFFTTMVTLAPGDAFITVPMASSTRPTPSRSN